MRSTSAGLKPGCPAKVKPEDSADQLTGMKWVAGVAVAASWGSHLYIGHFVRYHEFLPVSLSHHPVGSQGLVLILYE